MTPYGMLYKIFQMVYMYDVAKKNKKKTIQYSKKKTESKS